MTRKTKYKKIKKEDTKQLQLFSLSSSHWVSFVCQHNGMFTREIYNDRSWHVLHCSVSSVAIDYLNMCPSLICFLKAYTQCQISTKLQRLPVNYSVVGGNTAFLETLVHLQTQNRAAWYWGKTDIQILCCSVMYVYVVIWKGTEMFRQLK